MINRIKTQIKINKARKESKKLDKEIAEQNVEIEDLLKRIDEEEQIMKEQNDHFLDLIKDLDVIIADTKADIEFLKKELLKEKKYNSSIKL